MRNKDLSAMAVPVGVVGIVMLLVVPLPAALLDVLIAVNITASLVILLTSMYVRRPLDFSVFPSLILVFTLFRLGLNVASTRLVLRDGYAGHVIDSFGHIVVGGSLVIGLVIFLILVVIQFVVITNGAGRVAEVGARFTLDAMPGKQMAIDADLNSGLIDEDQARRRRQEVTAEADFYGAMDGGSKFVKGDAIAGVIITVINLAGGFVIGMVQMKMTAGESLNRFSLLTVGDGLVTQIPALLLSVSTGIVVTRASAEGDMGTSAARQLMQSVTALRIAGCGAIALALLPGMPKVPFMLVGAVLLLVSQRASGRQKAEALAQRTTKQATPEPVPDTPDQLIEQMRVPTLEILLAPDLVDLVGSGPDEDLLGRVRALRRKTAMELGIVVPPVRTRDSVDLPRATYVVRIAGVEVGRGQAPRGQVLALGDDLSGLPGTAVVEPVFGLPGRWVPVELRHAAEMSGATVVDRVSVLVTHLGSLVSQHAGRLLGREDVRLLTEAVKRANPSVVEELVPSLLSLGEVQRVLQGLLAEGVAIRDLSRIYEALSLRARTSTDPEGLIEAARGALGPALMAPHVQDGELRVLTLDPMVEQQAAESLRPREGGTQLLLDPVLVDRILGDLRDAASRAENDGQTVTLVCAPAIRPALRRLVALGLPRLPVLSYTEIADAGVQVVQTGVIGSARAVAARG